MRNFLLFSLLAVAILAAAQETRNNPVLTGVPSLTIAPDAIAGGMGDVGAATTPDIYSQHWNMAKYPFTDSSAGFGLSYTPWLRKLGVNDINLLGVAGYYTFGGVQSISASLRYFSLGEIILRESSVDIGTPVNPYELGFDIAYSRILAKNFSMGVALRFIASDLSAKDENYYPGYAFGADLGFYYQLPIKMSMGESKFSAAFHVSNIGSKISYDQNNTSNFIPTNMRLGVSYLQPFDKYNRISLSVDCNKLLVPTRLSTYTTGYNADDQSTWSMSEEQYSSIGSIQGMFQSFNDAPGGFAEEFKEVNWSIGLEYAYNEQFFARAGYFHEDETKGNRKFFSAGAGFKLSAFRLDVGYIIAVAQSNPLDQTLRFSLSFDVDGIRDLADRGARNK